MTSWHNEEFWICTSEDISSEVLGVVFRGKGHQEGPAASKEFHDMGLYWRTGILGEVWKSVE